MALKEAKMAKAAWKCFEIVDGFIKLSFICHCHGESRAATWDVAFLELSCYNIICISSALIIMYLINSTSNCHLHQK
jgi:hypothetical protein